MELPSPKCPYGYPAEQVAEILGEDRMIQFYRWTKRRGLPLGRCTGWRTSFLDDRNHPTECVNDPHGPLYPSIDIHHFVRDFGGVEEEVSLL